LPARAFIVNEIFVAFLLTTTAFLTVFFGVFGAYCAVCGILAAVNPSRPSPALSGLIPNRSHASGD
jgi:hypothetical protein